MSTFSSAIDNTGHYRPRAACLPSGLNCMQTALDLDGKIKATMSLRAAGGRKCLSVHVLDGTAAAPYEAAWCRSNRESIQNQRSERHRSQRSVLLRVLGRMSGHDRVACCARLRSSCRRSARSQHRSVTWRGLRLFCGSDKLATVTPWLPLKNRAAGMRRSTHHSMIYDYAAAPVRPDRRRPNSFSAANRWPEIVNLGVARRGVELAQQALRLLNLCPAPAPSRRRRTG